MRSTPLWFGPATRQRFAWLHLPDGDQARGGVVLVPTLAVEQMCAHRAIRALADHLAEVGVAALRFDHLGTGDSMGLTRDLDADSMVEGICEAISFLRRLGLEQIGLCGLRIGATAAAVASLRDEHVRALALWDPASSGRNYLREQRALKQLSIGETPAFGLDTDVELLGMVLSAEQAADLGALAMPESGPLAQRVFLLHRNDHRRGAALVEEQASEQLVIGSTDDLPGLVDVLPDFAQMPEQSLARLLEFFDASFDAVPVDLAPGEERSIAIGAAGAPSPIVERALVLGERRLFAIVTEPHAPTSAPTVVFLNAGLLPHVGPARMWVDLSRRLAALGLRSARLDLSGLGDSGEGDGQRRHVSYPREAVTDVAAVAGALSPQDPSQVVFVGLCAGAYHSIEAAIALDAVGACPINPILNFDPPEVVAGDDLDPSRQAVQRYNPLIRALRRFDRLRRFGEQHIPSWVWSLLDATALQRSPARGLETLVAGGTRVLLICGEVEAIPFQRRAARSMRRLLATGRFRLEVLENSDHTLFGAYARARASALVMEQLTAHFSPTTGEGVAPAAALRNAS